MLHLSYSNQMLRFNVFNVLHVRALYYTKNINHQQMHRVFFVNYNTLLHVSTLLGHIQGETFRCRYTKAVNILAQLYSAT
jgi:hypothetical protein